MWNDNEKSTDDRKECIYLQGSICLTCSTPNNLILVEGKEKLMRIYRNIINIGVEVEMNSGDGNTICSSCVDRLEDMSSFISWLLSNDEKLQYAIGRKEHVKYENPSYPINIDIFTCNDIKIGHNVQEVKENHGVIDIKENIFDTDLVNSTVANYKKESELHSQTFSENISLQNFVSKHGVPSLRNEKCEQNSILKQKSQYRISKHVEKDVPESDSCERSVSDNSNSTYLPLIQRERESSTSKRDSVTNTGEKPYQCDHCKKSFSSKNYIGVHRRMHTGESPFKCNCCEKKFSRNYILQNHLRIHTGDKPFKCDFCDKGFANNSNLRKHLFTHTGEKLYKCYHCKKSFARNYTLQRHLRTHTGDKPFNCNFCDKTFASNSNLRQHIFTHTKEKPYTCNHCQKGFAHSTPLGRHLRTHTEKTMKISECDQSSSIQI